MTTAKERAAMHVYGIANRAKITARKKIKREAQRALETPEERQARLQGQRVYLRAYRQRHKTRLQARRHTDTHREKQRKNMAAWRKANPEKNLAAGRQLRAQNREKLNAQQRARMAAQTPEERAAYAAKRAAGRLAHLETHLVKERTYNKTHPEIRQASTKRHAARKKGASVSDFTAAQWSEMKEHYDHRCVYCGRKMARLTQDHITPLSQGGMHTASNIVPACQSCNSKKHVGPPLKPVQPLLLTVAPAAKKKS